MGFPSTGFGVSMASSLWYVIRKAYLAGLAGIFGSSWTRAAPMATRSWNIATRYLPKSDTYRRVNCARDSMARAGEGFGVQ